LEVAAPEPAPPEVVGAAVEPAPVRGAASDGAAEDDPDWLRGAGGLSWLVPPLPSSALSPGAARPPLPTLLEESLVPEPEAEEERDVWEVVSAGAAGASAVAGAVSAAFGLTSGAGASGRSGTGAICTAAGSALGAVV
jgi:hypothetical protein